MAFLVAAAVLAAFVLPAQAAFTPEINYQGKLTDPAGVAVPDGSYAMEFSLYATATSGTPIWTEERTGDDEVQVASGLFSIMLGEVEPLSNIDFNQTLYLGVSIEGDPEMTPRKQIGAVPAAFVAEHANDAGTIGGVASTSFLRSDQPDTATGLLTFQGGILVSSGSSTIANLTTLTATTTYLVVNDERFNDLTGTGLENDSGVLTVDTSFFDTRYTSTTDLDTCSELAAIIAGETGSCGSLVLSASPTFTGTVNAAALSLSSTLTLSGSSANIALGSNYLSGDGGDEGIFIDDSGNVGIGTTTPGKDLDVVGSTNAQLALRHVNAPAQPFLFGSDGNGFGRIDGSAGLGFLVNGTEYLRIIHPGNVGIGTTTPSQMLTVAGNVRIAGALFDSNNSAGLSGYVLNSTGTGFQWVATSTLGIGGGGGSLFTDGGTTTYLTATTDHLAIGTTSASAKLTIDGGNILQRASGNPTLKGTYATSGGTFGVSVSGKYAYVAGYTAGLQIIDISNPASPSLVGTYDTPGTAFGVFVSGTYAYVADSGSGLQIIDISNPASPSLVGTYDTSGDALSVAVSGKYAYVADSGSGLHVIDISNPGSPSLVGTYNTSGDAISVFVSGRYAHVADSGSGLQIIDISNPGSPSLVGAYDTPGTAFGVFVSGTYAYVADDLAGLHVIDISNPGSPSLVGTYNTSGGSRGVFVSGKYAYVAGNTAGLQVIDISNPGSPSLVGTYDTPGFAISVSVSGKYAYVADLGSGLQVIDINGAEFPALYAGSIEAGTLNATENLIVGNDIYAQGGLHVGLSGIYSRGALSVGGSLYVGSSAAVGSDPLCWDGSGGSLYGDCASLAKWKTNVQPYAAGLSEILSLEAVTFDWKRNENGTLTDGNDAAILDPDTGFIADQAASTSYSFGRYDSKTGELRDINERAIMGAMVNAIKELYAEVLPLADKFVDGVLTLTEARIEYVRSDYLEANTVRSNNQLCVGDVCVDEATFLKMAEEAGGGPLSQSDDTPPESPHADTGTTTDPVAGDGSDGPADADVPADTDTLEDTDVSADEPTPSEPTPPEEPSASAPEEPLPELHATSSPEDPTANDESLLLPDLPQPPEMGGSAKKEPNCGGLTAKCLERVKGIEPSS